MTKEEAKDELKFLKKTLLRKEEIEALDMAISALKDRPTDGDLISRKELKDYLEKNISFGGIEKKFEFYDIIDSIPSADILDHARAIKEYCDGRKNCDNCLFGQNMDIIHGCDLRDTIPECWNLPEGEKGGAE